MYATLIVENTYLVLCLKKNAFKPSEHSPVRGRGMSKRLGGIIDCKDKTSLRHLIGFLEGVVIFHIERIACQPEKTTL